MAHLDHANRTGVLDTAATASRNSRYGLWLFAVYLLLYGGFVGISAFAPQLMEARPVADISLAISYGMALIVAAFLLALVYGWLCRFAAPEASQSPARAESEERR